MQEVPLDKIAVSIADARRMLGDIATATIYRLIDSGEVRTFRVGRRRLVSVDAIREYIDLAEHANISEGLDSTNRVTTR